MGTVLVRNIIVSVQTTLQDLNPAFRRWPERELVVYLNYGQRAIAKYLPQAGSRIDSFKLAPGTRQYLGLVLAANLKPSDGSTAADAFGIAFLGLTRNMGADGLTPGRALRDPSDPHTMNAGNPNWHNATAMTEVREALFDKAHPLHFYVYPPVHASTAVWAEIKWMAEPKRIIDGGAPGSERYTAAGAGTTDVIGISDLFTEDLQNYAVAMALLKGSKNHVNLPKSQAHAELFVRSINALGTVYNGVSPNLKTLPFANEIPGAT